MVREVLLYPHQPRPGMVDIGMKDPHRVAAAADASDHCVGLAATQLGEMLRIVVVDVSGHRKAAGSNGRLLLVNPRIVAAEGAEVGREGCLSIPDLTANVRRATRIEVEAGDRRIVSEGFEARCLQHEIDHLDGLLFLDRVDSLTADVFRRVRTS